MVACLDHDLSNELGRIQPGYSEMSGSHSPCTSAASGASPEAGERGAGVVQGREIVSQQPPWGQDPGQPYLPYGQGPQEPQPPYPGQQPGYVPPPGRRAQKPWPARHKVLTGILAVVALFVVAGIAGAAAGGTKTKTVTVPGPTVTVTQAAPAVTVTATATVTPTANAQGQSTQISQDGVYVIGQDIAGGTWHTSGGQQCYEATLGSTDTSNIIDNNNFTGPDTVSLAGAKAFDISGGCTWQREG
jgi:hypothetical protein